MIRKTTRYYCSRVVIPSLRHIAIPLIALSSLCLAADSHRPNVIVILADDFGWGDVSCNNPESVFRTPHLDRIATEGLRFVNAHTPHSVCTPTRYSLLTGRYAWRTELREGVLIGYGKSLIRPGRDNLATLLKRQGYRTGVFGKWHLGLDWEPVEGDPGDWIWGTQIITNTKEAIPIIAKRVNHDAPVRIGPTHIGFDTAYITPANNSNTPVWLKDDRIVGNPSFDEEGLYRDPTVKRDSVDDFHVKHAIEFIDASLKEDSSRPFFIYLPLNAAHATTLPPARFKGKTKDGSRGDKCLWVDESVGKVLDALDDRSLARDTLVIFSADNGPIPRFRYNEKSEHRASGPYRGYKTDIWDGGFRVPFLVRWPHRIQAGRVSDQLVCLTDVYATIAALMGEKMHEWAGEDSVNQLPVFLGETEQDLRTRMITQSNIGAMAIRDGDWKLIVDTTGSGGPRTPGTQPLVMAAPFQFFPSKVGQLYNIRRDPYEERNLWSQNPEKVETLRLLLKESVWKGRTR